MSTITEYRAGPDTRTLRNALGCFATGVTVVTALARDGSPVGATVNSFASVSLDPALLLVCIDHRSESARVLRGADSFAVNVLHAGQRSISSRFSSKGIDRFSQVEWQVGAFGAPVIASTLGVFECHRYAVQEAGDHFILLGAVQGARFQTAHDPLLFFQGNYRKLSCDVHSPC